jgi:hypothetical protein
MRRSLLSILSLLVIAGAGCEPITSPQISGSIGDAFPSRPIAQEKGFGEIPTIPAPPFKSGVSGSVRILAAFPDVPASVSVLRVSDGRPDDTLIRNSSNALGLPNGVIGSAPVGHNLTLDWNDGTGIHWTAAATGRRVEFTDEAHPVGVLTVSGLPTNPEVILTAEAFLGDHGVSTKRYGQPYIDPDWTAWWQSQTAQGRCMSAQTIQAVRSLSASMSFTETDFPSFPNVTQSNCVSAEFPSRVAVRWNTTQDGQGIFTNNGTPELGALIFVDVSANRVTSGFFTLAADPVRSDYPGLTLDEAREQLARGGQGGTPNGNVTVTTIRFEWYPISDEKVPATNYLYPALVGEGTIEYNNGTSGPYRIVVPLVKT